MAPTLKQINVLFLAKANYKEVLKFCDELSGFEQNSSDCTVKHIDIFIVSKKMVIFVV